MSTMEHLFMQIFERRDWLAGQLKQQGESYAQSVASNLLAAGGVLPPWLWTAAAGSDCWDARRPQELNKEQVVSGILYSLPHATTPRRHTVFSGKPLQKDVNVPQSKSFVAEKCITTPFSVSNCYPGDNEHQDIVVDSFDKIQRRSLEQREKKVSLGKKGKLTDGLSKRRSEIEYTGRITRSRATSIKMHHVKESLDLNSLPKFPVETGDMLIQPRSAIQQPDSSRRPLKVTKQVDCTKDSSKQGVSDPQMFSCSVLPVNIQIDTHNNVNCGTGRQICSAAALKPLSDVHPASFPPSVLDITNSASSLLPLDNNNPVQNCLDGIENAKDEDAPDAVYIAHSREKATMFTSSEIWSTMEPTQLISDDSEDWPHCGGFDILLGQEKQCTSSKNSNSQLMPLESLFGELLSQDYERPDNSLPCANLASDSMVEDCNSPPEPNIVHGITSTLPHVATSLETEHALNSIRARASNEMLDTHLEIDHQNTSGKTVVISDIVQSAYGEPSIGSFRKMDDLSIAAELPGKLHSAEAMNKREDKADIVVHEGQEEKIIESLVVVKPALENLHGELLHTTSSEDGKLNCCLEFSGCDAFEQDDNGSSSMKIPAHLAIEGKKIENITAEATKGTLELKVATCIDNSEANGMSVEAHKTQDGVQEVAEGSASQQTTPGAVKGRNQLLGTHYCSMAPTPSKESAGSYKINDCTSHSSKKNSMLDKSGRQMYAHKGQLEAKEVVPGKPLSTDKNYDRQSQTRYFLRSSTGHVNNSCKSNVSVLSSTHKHVISSNAKESETTASLRDAPVKSNVDDKATLTTAGVCNPQFSNRYLLRSSTAPSKGIFASKFREPNDSHCSRQSPEAMCDTSEIRYSKRRKVESRQSNCFGISPLLKFKSLYPDKDGSCSLKKGSGNGIRTCERFQQCHALKEMEKEISHSCHENPSECLPQNEKPQAEENDFHLERKEDRMSTSFLRHMQKESSLDCHLEGPADRDSTSSMNDLEINEFIGSPLVLKESVTVEDAPNMPDILNTSINGHLDSTCIQQMLNNAKSIDERKCQFLLSSIRASHSIDRDPVIPDEVKPELEGFSIESPIMVNEFIFDDPNLQKLTRERASALEQLHRSINIPTPFSRFSTKHRIHRVPDLSHSLPSELLMCMSLDDHLQSSGADDEDLGAANAGSIAHIHWKTMANFDSSLLEKSGLHSSPFSSVQFFDNVPRGPFTPPVEKFPQKVLERKGCGSERTVSNPELTCFRIDEHARSLEENTCREEYQDTSKERLGSRERGFSSNRKALADVTSIYQNAAAIDSTAKRNLDPTVFGSEETEVFFSSEMNDNKNLEHGCGSHTISNIHNKENGFLSASRNKVQKASVSLHNRLSKASTTVGEQKRSQATLEKKASNIVSNISSFVPLVWQKQQAAAPITGKREIKVKALEAAEAAKRLAAKKENERKMRKEAARLERVKLEQENARQLELKQKQKEEEKKKKEANVAARKRQREEVERKEKQRKRNCIEGARQRKGHEERVHAEEKDLQPKAVEEKEHKKKVLPEEAGMEHKAEKGQKIAEVVKAVEVGQDRTKIAGDVQNASNSLQSCEEPKTAKPSCKVSGLCLEQAMQDRNVKLKENRQSQSYEISPYRDSDDEGGEDDKRPKKKFVPSWARRESLVQHLLSMRHLDPTKIFCQKRSFDLSEVFSLRTRQREF